MTRDLCIEFPNAFYHVYARGINRQNLYNQVDDFNYFLALCRKTVKKFNIKIFAFCLMDNHYHLYLSTPDANLSKVMKFLNQTYAVHFLKTYPEKDGHVFRGRYKRKIVDSNNYSLVLINYIHHNPVQAKLVESPSLWKWSSYQSYINPELKFDFIDYDWVLDQFDSVIAFQEFHSDNQFSTWNPKDNSKAGMFIGEDQFIVDICDRYINFDNLKNKSIKSLNELISIYNKETLDQFIKSLDCDPKLQQKIKVFLFNEFTDLSLTKIGKEIDRSANATRMLIKRFKEEINSNKMLTDIIAKLI